MQWRISARLVAFLLIALMSAPPGVQADASEVALTVVPVMSGQPVGLLDSTGDRLLVRDEYGLYEVDPYGAREIPTRWDATSVGLFTQKGVLAIEFSPAGGGLRYLEAGGDVPAPFTEGYALARGPAGSILAHVGFGDGRVELHEADGAVRHLVLDPAPHARGKFGPDGAYYDISQGPQLYRYDLANGTSEWVANLCCSFSFGEDGFAYFVNTTGAAGVPSRLTKVDIATGATTVIGTLPGPYHVEAFAGGRLYVVGFANGTSGLGYIDLGIGGFEHPLPAYTPPPAADLAITALTEERGADLVDGVVDDVGGERVIVLRIENIGDGDVTEPFRVELTRRAEPPALTRQAPPFLDLYAPSLVAGGVIEYRVAWDTTDSLGTYVLTARLDRVASSPQAGVPELEEYANNVAELTTHVKADTQTPYEAARDVLRG